MAEKNDISDFLSQCQSGVVEKQRRALRQVDDLRSELTTWEAEEKRLISSNSLIKDSIKNRRASTNQLQKLYDRMLIENGRVNEIKEELLLCHDVNKQYISELEKTVANDQEKSRRTVEEKAQLERDHEINMEAIKRELGEIQKCKASAQDEFQRDESSLKINVEDLKEKLVSSKNVGLEKAQKLRDSGDQMVALEQTLKGRALDLETTRGKCASKKADLANIASANQSIKENLKAIHETIARLEMERQGRKSSDNSLKSQADESRRKLEAIEQQRAALNDQISVAKREFEESIKNASHLKAQLEAILNDNVEENFAKASEDANRLNCTLDEINDKLKRLPLPEDVQQVLMNALKEKEALENKKEEIQGKARSNGANYEHQCSDLRTQLNEEISNAKKMLNDAQIEIETSSKEIEAKKKEVYEKTENIEALKRKLDESQNVAQKNVMDKKSDLRNQLAQLEDEVKSKEALLVAKEKAFATSSNLQQVREENKKEIEAVEAELTSAQGRITLKKKTLTSLEENMKKEKVVVKAKEPLAELQDVAGSNGRHRWLVSPTNKKPSPSKNRSAHKSFKVSIFDSSSDEDEDLFA